MKEDKEKFCSFIKIVNIDNLAFNVHQEILSSYRRFRIRLDTKVEA